MSELRPPSIAASATINLLPIVPIVEHDRGVSLMFNYLVHSIGVPVYGLQVFSQRQRWVYHLLEYEDEVFTCILMAIDWLRCALSCNARAMTHMWLSGRLLVLSIRYALLSASPCPSPPQSSLLLSHITDFCLYPFVIPRLNRYFIC